jgi:phage FluMu protein gp41
MKLSLFAVGVSLLQVSAEVCDGTDEASALQTQTVRHSGAMESQAERLAEAIHATPVDADFICLSAEAGEQAPFPGTFKPQSGAKVEVDVGYVATEGGKYCVKNSIVALMQRAASLQHTSSFETAVANKGLDSSTNKFKKPVCGGANLQCKVTMKAAEKQSMCDAAIAGDKFSGLSGTGCKSATQVAAVCNVECPITCREIVTQQYRDVLCAQAKVSWGGTPSGSVNWATEAHWINTAYPPAECTEANLKTACGIY